MTPIEDYILKSKEERQSHLDLTSKCIEIGGNSTQFKGLLAHHLKTTIPKKSPLLCHACHNAKCSNPNHLYWGTPRENIDDGISNGTIKTVWQRMVDKHGDAAAREIYRQRSLKNTNARVT